MATPAGIHIDSAHRQANGRMEADRHIHLVAKSVGKDAPRNVEHMGTGKPHQGDRLGKRQGLCQCYLDPGGLGRGGGRPAHSHTSLGHDRVLRKDGQKFVDEESRGRALPHCIYKGSCAELLQQAFVQMQQVAVDCGHAELGIVAEHITYDKFIVGLSGAICLEKCLGNQ